MSKRKRTTEESSDTDEESSTELTDFQIVEGLSHFWAPGSIECFNYAVDALRSVRKNPPRPPTDKEGTYKYGQIHHRYSDWIDFCNFEDNCNKLGNLNIEFKKEPFVNVCLNKFMTRLQFRYLEFLKRDSPIGLSSLDLNLKRYFLFVSMAEHEAQQGSLDDDYELSMIGDACWTPAEKRRFFDAVERCSRGDVVEISRRVGPTKTTVQVGAYLNLLDEASKGLREETTIWDDERYSAREMSPLFMVQETRMSAFLNDTLETESHAKHQELLTRDHDKVTKALELFEVWNMSSLTRL